MSWSCRTGRAERSAQGFTACGDATFAWVEGAAALFAVVDALGHGPDAAASAQIATEVMARAWDRPLKELFLECDRALGGRRAVVLSAVQLREHRVWYAGIGNVELYGPPKASRPPNTPGVVGRGLRAVREWELRIEDGQRWVLASDGVQRRALAGALQQTRHLPAEEAAGQLLRLAGRADDDASVVVMDWECD